jgi:hypothetical protein
VPESRLARDPVEAEGGVVARLGQEQLAGQCAAAAREHVDGEA